VGDIFGAPLAIEALVAFFIESTFLGVWVFGWDRLSRRLHAAVMWLVALSSTISAMWILIANAFMQHPVGYAISNGRAELTNFLDVITNRVFITHFPHVLSAGLTTAGFFVLGICAYHLVRGDDIEFYKRSFRIASIIAPIGVVLVALAGHAQGQLMREIQPTKLAAMEAIRFNVDPADLSLLTIESPDGDKDIVDIRIPFLLSFLLYNSPKGEVQGMTELQAEYSIKYGPGDYIPPVFITYWSFRIMVGIGLLLLATSLLALYIDRRNLFGKFSWFLKILPWLIVLPYLANTTGWMLTEIGRFPWVVYGLLKMENGVSIAITGGMLLTSLIGFLLLYGLLMAATFYLMLKYARAGSDSGEEKPVTDEISPLLGDLQGVDTGGGQ
jgi:cytochrome d ubiquinol oxidase subunit I